jgi:EAL domain-containing protein (putative c-di-GMP-specific phosphodiesterase class I)/CheY-like chemotaxis protein
VANIYVFNHTIHRPNDFIEWAFRMRVPVLASTPLTSRRRRFFIVEDDADARALLSLALQANGDEVIGGDDAQLPFPEQWSPDDVFLIDLCLRGGDGFSLLERLATRRFPGQIVLMSAYSRGVLEVAEDVARAARLRVSGVLSKPFGLQTLLDTLASAAPVESSWTAHKSSGAQVSLAEAIEMRRLLFHFQPIVSARDGRPEGVEALARLREPSGVVRSAAAEISTAPRDALLSLSRLAAREAVRLNALLKRRRQPIRVSINIPSWQINAIDLDQVLCGIDDEAALAQALVIEVSEADRFDSSTEAKKLVARKVLKGYRFSLDDFGVRNSNLDRLADLPFQELKIDRRFVDGCAHDGFKHAVCRNAVAIAGKRGARVVAEGVERAEDARALCELGVDALQGYHVAKPMNQLALYSWLAETASTGRGG